MTNDYTQFWKVKIQNESGFQKFKVADEFYDFKDIEDPDLARLAVVRTKGLSYLI